MSSSSSSFERVDRPIVGGNPKKRGKGEGKEKEKRMDAEGNCVGACRRDGYLVEKPSEIIGAGELARVYISLK